MKKIGIDKTSTGIAGEYYVLAQLAQRGFIATMTLSHTKAIDILVTSQTLDILCKIEVKTTEKKPFRESLFGRGLFYGWTMSAKHETIRDPKLFYCFVALHGAEELPRFFLVHSGDVARYVRWQHRKWLKTRQHKVNDTTMRKFRIPLNDPQGYENNWKVLSGR